MPTDPMAYLGPVIEAAKTGFQIRPGDTINEEGLVVCGKCGQLRQTKLNIRFNEDAAPIIVPCTCQCDVEIVEKEKEEKRLAEEKAALSALRAESLIAPKFKEAVFENFEVTDFNELNYRLIKRYATGFDDMFEKNQGLLMWGDNGTGKSFAAGCIANYLLDKGVPVVMTTITQLTEMIMRNVMTESQIISKLNRAKLVIFDEFGAERDTDYAIERAYTLIDSRYRNKLPMIITTNLTQDELLNEEESSKHKRLYDRILENCYPMHFKGRSWRRYKAKKRFDEMEALLNETK